jgi:polyribonucleotide nucleotidyltransferase
MTINFDHHKVELDWGGQPLTLETGKVARQADGAVVATLGETVVLATVVSAKEPKAGIDFFPLTVNYQEKYFAAGKIPGGYFKREGRPTEAETLTSRLIDRPIRPLFPAGYKNETQVIITTLQHDMENQPDVLAMVAASAALTISGVPFMGPIGAARVGYVDGEYVLNLPIDRRDDSKLDLVMAGTADAVLMVESEAQELSEEVMLGAVMFGHEQSQKVIDAIIKLAELAAKEPRDFEPEDTSALETEMLSVIEAELRDAYKNTDKQTRYAAVDAAKAKVKAHFIPEEGEARFTPEQVGSVFKSLQAKVVRWNILDTKTRIDGRDLETVRPIVSEVGVLPRTHGSALFTRGETQALVVATLGTADDEQFIDSLEGTYKQNFLLHYNFPPYSVGEAGRMGSPGRREIGHGKLAWRAINPVRPTAEEFPYTLRVVSEITESNGSSSMATVCGTSLALMDAGVPMKKAVAGITEEIMKIALGQAKDGRNHILGEMAKAIDTARSEVGEFAPRIETIKIPTDKIREVIGTGGKVIREIVEKTGAKINIEDDGTVKVSSSDGKQIDAAIKWIKSITDEPEVGEIYQGTVVKTADFGAFVNFFGSRDGLVHISQLADQRVGKTTDVVKEGDKVWVKLLGFDERGKVRLSMKVVDQETGKERVNEEQDAE